MSFIRAVLRWFTGEDQVCWNCGHVYGLHKHYHRRTYCSARECSGKDGTRCKTFR